MPSVVIIYPPSVYTQFRGALQQVHVPSFRLARRGLRNPASRASGFKCPTTPGSGHRGHPRKHRPHQWQTEIVLKKVLRAVFAVHTRCFYVIIRSCYNVVKYLDAFQLRFLRTRFLLLSVRTAVDALLVSSHCWSLMWFLFRRPFKAMLASSERLGDLKRPTGAIQ